MQNKIIIAVVLAVFAMWGSREHTHIKETETWTTTKTQLETKVASLTSQNTQLDSSLKRSIATKKKTTPVVLPNGQVAYVTEETSESIEEAISSLKSEMQTRIDTLSKQNSDLAAHVKSKEIDIKKTAPFWNVVASSSVLEYADVTQWQFGGGVNLGPFSASLTNPAALTIQPRLQLMMRL